MASWRETPDYCKALRRMVLAAGRRVGQEDPSSLENLVMLEDALARAWHQAVNDLRAAGNSDRMIGEALGITQQAVQQRWAKVPAEQPV